MYWASSPQGGECCDDEVPALRIVEADTVELNNHLSLINGFINFSGEAMTTFLTAEVNEQSMECDEWIRSS